MWDFAPKNGKTNISKNVSNVSNVSNIKLNNNDIVVYISFWFLSMYNQVNKTRWSSIVFMLGQCPKRWPNI